MYDGLFQYCSRPNRQRILTNNLHCQIPIRLNIAPLTFERSNWVRNDFLLTFNLNEFFVTRGSTQQFLDFYFLFVSRRSHRAGVCADVISMIQREGKRRAQTLTVDTRRTTRSDSADSKNLPGTRAFAYDTIRSGRQRQSRLLTQIREKNTTYCTKSTDLYDRCITVWRSLRHVWAHNSSR